MVGIPRGRFLPFGLGMITRFVGLGSVPWQFWTNFIFWAGVWLTSLSIPAVFFPSLVSVICRTASSKFVELMSINFCQFRSWRKFPCCLAIKILWRRFITTLFVCILLILLEYCSCFFLRLLSLTWLELTCHWIRFIIHFIFYCQTQMQSAWLAVRGKFCTPIWFITNQHSLFHPSSTLQGVLSLFP